MKRWFRTRDLMQVFGTECVFNGQHNTNNALSSTEERDKREKRVPCSVNCVRLGTRSIVSCAEALKSQKRSCRAARRRMVSTMFGRLTLRNTKVFWRRSASRHTGDWRAFYQQQQHTGEERGSAALLYHRIYSLSLPNAPGAKVDRATSSDNILTATLRMPRNLSGQREAVQDSRLRAFYASRN